MKMERHAKIIELVKNNEIETQEELAKMLKLSGFKATQATVSRDIRELKLTKVSSENGAQKYDVLVRRNVAAMNEKLLKIFKEGVRSVDYAGNIIVIKTLEGMAMAVAAAVDSMGHNEILGCIAGDDTIFCAVKDGNDAMKVMLKFKELINIE